jgi:hypothetical protein
MALRTLRYLPGGCAQGARAGAHLTVSPRASVEGHAGCCNARRRARPRPCAGMGLADGVIEAAQGRRARAPRAHRCTGRSRNPVKQAKKTFERESFRHPFLQILEFITFDNKRNTQNAFVSLVFVCSFPERAEIVHLLAKNIGKEVLSSSFPPSFVTLNKLRLT